MIHLVTDSTSDLTRELAKQLGITVVPLVVRFGEDQYRDGVDLTSDDFYRRLASDPVHPTTSQPTPEDFAKVYQRLLDDPADQVVSIHISSKLSGTLQSAHIAAQPLDPARIHLVDSESASAGLQLLLHSALQDIAAGRSAAEVEAATLQRRGRTNIFLMPDTLLYLQRGGRIGRAQALVGGLLNVKPILTTLHGEVAPQARVRSRRKGIEQMVALLTERGPLERLAAFHCGAPELLDELRPALSAAFPDMEILLGQVGPVVGTYTGPGGLGVAYLAAG
jgi:DegV family protein with EDD domain